MLLLTRLSRYAAMAALLIAGAGSAHAAVVTYSDLNQFNAALTGTVASDNFDDLAAAELVAGPLSRNAGGTGYRASVNDLSGIDDDAADDFFTLDGGAGNTYLSTNFYQNEIVLSQFSQQVRGLGAFFFGTSLDGAVMAGQTLLLKLTSASGISEALISSNGAATFYGFVSDTDITSLSVRVIQGSSASFPTVDDLIVAVPEPGTLLLVLGGAALLGARRRKA